MKYFLIIFLAIGMVSCSKEAKLTPSEPEDLKLLPQGNNSYDDSIMAVYNKYATYILYRFTQADYGYNQIDRKLDSAFDSNPAYISPVLRFLHENIFEVFPEDFLKKTMPYKILLASYIGGKNTRSTVNFASTYASLTIGWADSTFLQQTTPEQIRALRVNLVRFYMERALRAGAIKIPEGMMAYGPQFPTVWGNVTSVAQKNQYGVIEPVGTTFLNAASDFLGYVQAISTRTKTDIENSYFRPNVDTKGAYRAKYDIVVNYFQNEFGLDLQAIGNSF